MTAVNCPLCELRFASRNERDWHLNNDHHHTHPHRPAAPAGTDPSRPDTGPRPEPEERV